jgi:beta-glucosidase
MRMIRVTAAQMIRKPILLVVGAIILAACSSSDTINSVASLVGVSQGQAETSPQRAVAPETGTGPALPDGSLANSTDIHPAIWPLNSAPPKDPAVEAEVARLLSQMTLEEKIGQMLQPDIKAITLDDVTRYHLGSILNGGSAGPNSNLRAPAPEWLKAADAYYDASMRDRLKIPLMWGIDAVHGHGHITGATIFPHNIALGAMRDPDLVRRIGEITAQEIRVTGQDWTFAPTIAVVRDDRWGRSYEGYGEEPQGVAANAAAMVEGLQGKPGNPDFLRIGHVLASIKHFIGDGATDAGVNAGNATYGEAAMRDLFAPPYLAAIRAGARNVMISYSGWRGTKMHVQKGLVDDVLVGRMGFAGFVISDYQAIEQVPGCTVSNCPGSVNAGVDMIMTADDWKGLYTNLLNQTQSGAIPMARIDEAVARILRVKVESGLMTAGRPSARPFAGHFEMLGSSEHRAVARQAVRESLVLLKNDGGLLPLSPRSHVLVAGDGAANMSKQTGGWTITWQGTQTNRADFPQGTTIYEGIKATVEAAGGTADLSIDGSFRERPDVAIVVFGENAYAEGAGNIATLEYQPGDKRDLRLLQRLQAQGVPVVAVFLSGRPLYVTPELNVSNAFVAAWQPGSEGGGVADLLFANADGSVAYDFRGRLSFSWPRAPDQYALNIGTEPYFPLFSYGYGLTYGAPQNIGRMSEAVAARQATAPATVSANERNVLFEKGAAVGGWSVFAGGQRVTTTASQQGLTATRNAESELDVSWATHVPVSLTISGAPANFMHEADRGMGLAMTLRVDHAPASNVVLGMGCGPLCGGKLDFTGVLKNLQQRGGWNTVNVPLSCLRSAGTDLASVPTALAVTATGNLALAVSSVKISRDGEMLSCAEVPPVTAAAAMTGPGHKEVFSRVSKKKAVLDRGTKKKKAVVTHVRKSNKKSPVHSDRKPARRGGR